MTNNKTVKEFKREIKEINVKIEGLKAEKHLIESKGCFSDHELDERDKKINAINNEIHYLEKEKIYIKQSIVTIENKKWLNNKGEDQ